MSKLLGIDYGDKRVGLAIGDFSSRAVGPFKVLENNHNLFKNLQKIVTEENIAQIILGWPLNLKNLPTIQTQKVKDFSEKLKKQVKIPIILEDERFTTKIFKNVDKKKIDALAAMNILETYLNRGR